MSHYMNMKLLLFLFLLTLYQAKGDDLNYFSDGIDYWGDKRKKN